MSESGVVNPFLDIRMHVKGSVPPYDSSVSCDSAHRAQSSVTQQFHRAQSSATSNSATANFFAQLYFQDLLSKFYSTF